MRLRSLGAMARSAWTTPSDGRPRVSGFQVFPLSSDLKIPPGCSRHAAFSHGPLARFPHGRVDNVRIPAASGGGRGRRRRRGGDQRRGRGRHRRRGPRAGARAVRVTGVELAEKPERCTARVAYPALRRRFDRRLDHAVLAENAADGGVGLPAEGSVLALHNEAAARLARKDGDEHCQVERGLHALLVLAMRLPRTGATAYALDDLARLLDGVAIRALRVDARAERGGHRSNEQQHAQDCRGAAGLHERAVPGARWSGARGPRSG